MDIDKNLVKKEAEYIMLNACSADCSGLYNGKAGMAIALFETASLLDDEYLEEQAFQTIQEALLTKTKDASFENGLSGIAYALLYLMQNNFVDADFDELFGDKLCLIHEYASNLCMDYETGELQMHSMKIIYFLDYHYKYTYNKKSLELRERLLVSYADMFRKYFSDFGVETGNVPKIVYLSFFEEYLRILHDCRPEYIPCDIIDNYISSYEDGRWMSRFVLSTSLYGIAEAADNVRWKKVALRQADLALLGMNVNRESLKLMIDTLFRKIPLKSYQVKSGDIKKYIFATNEYELSRNLLAAIKGVGISSGYANGLSRLLLCAVNVCSRYVRNDMLRPI